MVDGQFTNWSVGWGGAHEWSGVTPAVGRFTNCYFDFDGTSLHILNDWIYNDAQPVSAHCFNQFDAWTGGGSERWQVKVFGDGRVQVRLNGQLEASDSGVST